MTTTPIFSKAGLRLATGYTRVVHGKRGDFVEFTKDQINWESFHPGKTDAHGRCAEDRCEYRGKRHRIFKEYHSNCASQVMLYEQKQRVGYADYRIGRMYIAPEDIRTAGAA